MPTVTSQTARPPQNASRIAEKNSRHAWTAVAIVIVAIVVQAAFLATQPDARARNESSDYNRFFEPVAANVLAGRGLVEADGRPATHYPPGYVSYLVGIFWVADALNVSRLELIAIANVVEWAAVCALILAICQPLFGRGPAVLASLLLIVYPPGLWLIKQPNTEIPFILLLYVAVWLFARNLQAPRAMQLLMVGVVLGLAALVRPVALFLGVWFGAVLLAWHWGSLTARHFKLATLPLVGFLVAILPWQLHLYSLTSSIKPLSTLGPTAMVDGLAFAVIMQAERGPEIVPADVYALMERVQANRFRLGSTSRVIEFMAEEARREPWSVMKLLALKVVRPWYGTVTLRREGWVLLINSLLLAGASLGYTLWRKTPGYEGRIVMLVAGLAGYFWIMATIVTPLARYLVPGLALFMILPAFAGHSFLQKFAGKWYAAI
ncbi:MAG: glycosyltransferase family 39 protein [Acidobacteriales bacterium]|nr:glycosyltransferase family 39 protein [Terriglobales bacterium]